MIKIKDHQFTGHFTDNQSDRIKRMLAFVEQDLSQGNLMDFEVMKVNEPKTKVRVKYRETLELDFKTISGLDAEELSGIFKEESSESFAVDNLLFKENDTGSSVLDQFFDSHAKKTLEPITANQDGDIIRVFNSKVRFLVTPIFDDGDFRMGSRV